MEGLSAITCAVSGGVAGDGVAEAPLWPRVGVVLPKPVRGPPVALLLVLGGAPC